MCLRVAAASVCLTLCSWLGIALSRQSEGVATIWLSNGILFGLVITQPRRVWLGYFAVGLAADTTADLIYGDPFRLAIGVSLANSIEVVSSCLLLTRWFGVPLNLSRRRPLVGFLLIAVVGAAAVSSALGATWTLLFLHAGTWWAMFRTWYLGDMLGMAILGPMTFMLQRQNFLLILNSKELPKTLFFLLIPVLVTLFVFTHSSDPLTFLLFPALLLIVFRLGSPGTVLTLCAMAVLAIGLTVKGHGPLMLIAGEHMMLRRIVVAQVFLAVALFTMFPVAALLEEREALQSSLAESEARHRHLANADDLTGLWNRRAFNLRLEHEWQEAMEDGRTLALLLLDADLFKSHNDLYGHLGGDQCLQCIASILAAVVKDQTSTVARFGGEEFAIILPGAEMTQAAEVAEQIRQAIVDRGYPHLGTTSGVQTVSIGVATLVPSLEIQASALVTMADRALYRAKDLGRNRVVTA